MVTDEWDERKEVDGGVLKGSHIGHLFFCLVISKREVEEER